MVSKKWGTGSVFFWGVDSGRPRDRSRVDPGASRAAQDPLRIGGITVRDTFGAREAYFF